MYNVYYCFKLPTYIHKSYNEKHNILYYYLSIYMFIGMYEKHWFLCLK